MRRLSLLVCLLTCWADLSLADNGALARAVPVANIVVDGHLDEWPTQLPPHRIALNGNADTVAPDANFDASFRAGYNRDEGAIYLALEIVDDLHVAAEDAEADWMQYDSVILYVDYNHTTTGSGAALYLAMGEQRRMLSDAHSWDAEVAKADWSTVEVAVARDDERHATVYEWRLESSRALAPNEVLGLDFLLNDQDAPEAGTSGRLFSWGPGFGKSQAGGRTGDLWLIDPSQPTGTLTGHLALASTSTSEQATPPRVRVQLHDDPSLRLDLSTDEAGLYRIDELPAGTYSVTSDHPIVRATDEGARMVAPAAPTTVQVVADTLATAPTMARALAASAQRASVSSEAASPSPSECSASTSPSALAASTTATTRDADS
ncbi:MAG: sugar-binding protein, partial [Pseudomonadota bacterium]